MTRARIPLQTCTAGVGPLEAAGDVRLYASLVPRAESLTATAEWHAGHAARTTGCGAEVRLGNWASLEHAGQTAVNGVERDHPFGQQSAGLPAPGWPMLQSAAAQQMVHRLPLPDLDAVG